MPDIVVVGDLIDDIVVVPNERPRADTDTLSSIRHVGGGSAANTAAWIGHLGAQVRFVGMVGERDVARHESELRAHGVTTALQAHPSLPTGSIVLLIDGERRSMFTERGANVALDCDAVELGGASALHVTGYSLFGALDAGASFERLIARAVGVGVPVSITPGSAGFISDFGAERFRAVIDGATVLFPNLAEGQMLTGLDDPIEVATALSALAPVVALTLGSAGVLVSTDSAAPQLVAAVPSTTRDPTGAGDAFAAGFLVEWTSSGHVLAAAEAGARAAASAIGVIGGRPALGA